jgi:ABC-type lipoprotein release transport system permease subunit
VAVAEAELAVLSWQEMTPTLDQMIQLVRNSYWFMYLLIYLVAAVGILNTQRMSAMERRREFGVMMAIGMRPRRLFRTLLVETAVLGLAGAAIGALLGGALTWYHATAGFNLGMFSNGETFTYMGVTMSERLRFVLTPRTILEPVAHHGRRRGDQRAVAGRARCADPAGTHHRGTDLMLLKLAWRNLWRHRGRTLIMASAVALAYGILLVGLGVNSHAHERMLTEAARAAGGDVLVHARGYWDTRATDLVVEDAAATVERLRAVPGVAHVIPRVLTMGLVSTSADNRPVLLQGIRPELEVALRDPARDLDEGTFLDADMSAPIVLGWRLAQRLEVGIGDRVVLTGTGRMAR